MVSRNPSAQQRSSSVSPGQTNRRDFLKTSAAVAAAGIAVPYFPASLSAQESNPADSGRMKLGCIGTGSRWEAVGPNAMEFADCVAVCDVDKNHAAKGVKYVEDRQKRTPVAHEDYRKILDDPSIDVVTIVTPDHWHTKIAIEALKSGKHVYCEKPLTLTIEEGKLIGQTVEETGKTFQVGTQQRSEMGARFLQAVALIRAGRIGDLQEVECRIGGAPTSGPLKTEPVPPELNWERWLGQTPLVDYIPRRCHYEFRWWYEYSGGKMTDWGAHHVDIASWASGKDNTGPVKVTPVSATHPVPLDANGMPTRDNEYNAATKFNVVLQFADGLKMIIRDDEENGVLFTGTDGRFFVNRGKITGKPVEDLKENPLPEDLMTQIYGGDDFRKGNAHMRNFFTSIAAKKQPVSDVFTHHRALTNCHLANIAIRLGRELQWDPEAQQIVGDDQARSMQAREQRKGYEIVV
jgi:predicted dehydrogenase